MTYMRFCTIVCISMLRKVKEEVIDTFEKISNNTGYLNISKLHINNLQNNKDTLKKKSISKKQLK